MTPHELEVIRARAHSPLKAPTARVLNQAILDLRALLEHIDQQDQGAEQPLPTREQIAGTLAEVYWPEVGMVSRSDMRAADAILNLLKGNQQ